MAELGFLISFIIEKQITTIVKLPLCIYIFNSRQIIKTSTQQTLSISAFLRKVNLNQAALVRDIPNAILLLKKKKASGILKHTKNADLFMSFYSNGDIESMG